MALNKIKNIKGIDCGYWKIVICKENYLSNTTDVNLGLYKDSTIKAENPKENIIYIEKKRVPGIDLTRETIYPLLKVSKIVKGVETNFFVDAVDC